MISPFEFITPTFEPLETLAYPFLKEDIEVNWGVKSTVPVVSTIPYTLFFLNFAKPLFSKVYIPSADKFKSVIEYFLLFDASTS